MSRRRTARLIAVVITFAVGMVGALALVRALSPETTPVKSPVDAPLDALVDADGLDAALPDAAGKYIDFVDPDASVEILLPGWPGWPLPATTTLTPMIFCQGTFGVTRYVRDPKCSRAETLEDIETKKHGIEAFGEVMSKSQTVRCVARLGGSVVKRRVELDPEAGIRCIEATIQEISDGWHDVIESAQCNGYVIGRQKDGEPCGQPWECLEGLACVGFTNKGDGRCKELPKVGARCGNGNPDKNLPLDIGDRPACAPGARCAPWGGTCEARIKLGRPCANTWDCMEGLACRGKKCTGEDRVSAGGACVGVYECATGLYCAGTDYMNKLGSCTEKKGAGETCRDDTECKGRCKYDNRERKCISWCQSR